eukprot:TRINITY_DN62183_c0_g1_i1.p1 TRINITY_DN62183_c0_g1~~TRINITY_DN62183_c0_g1_i1.p1  ORF type:complete len:1151 (-),score=112.61 TRINITY_DN62183_c0_g1_i1:2006-5458(-)
MDQRMQDRTPVVPCNTPPYGDDHVYPMTANGSNTVTRNTAAPTTDTTPGEAEGGVEMIHVHMHDPKANAQYKYPSNYISTTKYTPITFLPKNLLEQFQRYANIYFLANVIVSLFPALTPIHPSTTIMPLAFVLAVAAIKDGLEDLARWREDKKANSAKHQVVREGQITTIQASHIQVGDVLYLRSGDAVPADLILIASEKDSGEAYIETSNLDGETNMKPRRALACTKGLQTPQAVQAARITITADPPNPSLVKWKGTLEYHNNSAPLPLTLNEFLFRGCTVRNTGWVYGVVVYAGKHTKLMQNLKKKSAKRSMLDKKLNKLIIVIAIINALLCIGLGICAVVFKNATASNSFYLEEFTNEHNFFTWLFTTFTYFLLLSYMIPISLFVTIEFCKAAQAQLMQWDDQMIHEGRHMKVKTSNLNEDLAQVKFLFTDKTGTLTENKMVFSRCRVLGVSFDEMLYPGSIGDYLQRSYSQPLPFHNEIVDFMLALSLCHTVVLSTEEGGDYEGQSPDEVALIRMCAANRFKLKAVAPDSVTVEILGREMTYQLLATLPFSSDRKRMSVVVRTPQNELVLFSKGADSAMLPNSSANGHISGKPWETSDMVTSNWVPVLAEELQSMAQDGLRTLVVGARRIPEEEFERWSPKFQNANLAMKNRDTKIEDACKELEHDLELMGVTAVEDRLQDQVPETIKFFIDAGVVVWVLTGDKRETAVNIAGACKLIDINTDTVFHMDAGDDPTQVQAQLSKLASEVGKPGGAPLVLIIDGETLEVVLNNHRKDFSQLAEHFKSAVCCRLNPLQKSKVVNVFQDGNNIVAMSVGDGANDVSMIQAARVGVGIMGLEGSQAELASDYAIPRFKHLIRLCAVHGRYSMYRNSFLIQYSFYKNNIVSTIQIFFSIFNGFTGQTLFDDWLLAVMNVVFLFLPPLFAGIFEKDIDEFVLEKDPQLYLEAGAHGGFNAISCALWALSVIFHSIFIFFGAWSTLVRDDIAYERTSDLWIAGTFVMTAVMTVCLYKAALHLRYWTPIMIGSMVLSAGVYTLYVVVYSMLFSVFARTHFYQQAWTLLADIKFWLFWMCCLGFVLSIDYALLYIQRTMFPTYRDKVRYRIAQESKPWRFKLPWYVLLPIVLIFLALLLAVIILHATWDEPTEYSL